jgi:hypothetical protein
VQPAPDPASSVHRRLATRSALLTVLVYGSLVTAVAFAPGLLCGAIGAFLLYFYRREAAIALRYAWRRGPWPASGPRWPMALPVEEVDR